MTSTGRSLTSAALFNVESALLPNLKGSTVPVVILGGVAGCESVARRESNPGPGSSETLISLTNRAVVGCEGVAGPESVAGPALERSA